MSGDNVHRTQTLQDLSKIVYSEPSAPECQTRSQGGKAIQAFGFAPRRKMRWGIVGPGLATG